MKFLKLIVLFCIFPASFFAQKNQTLIIDSPEYKEAKSKGELYLYDLEAPADLFVPKSGKPLGGGGLATGAKSACDCYIEPDSSYTLALQPNDDGSSALINIPFNFVFYGVTYTSLYINNNGNITFTGPMSTFSATAFPSNGNQNLAPFWGDVDTGSATNTLGEVVYKIDASGAMYINWEDVGYFNEHGDKRNTFQLTITDGAHPAVESGNVAFCYQDMEWTTGDASGGTNGFGGTPATAGANKGDNIGYFLIARFDHAGSDFDGALGNPDGISWLDNKSFFFDVSGAQNVPPIPEGVSNCDTFRVCSFGDTADFAINFLSPEVSQTTSITYNNGGLTSLQELSNTAGNTGQLILRIVGDPSNAGTYTITVTGTDDFVPAGVTTISFVIEIEDSPIPMDPIISPTEGCDSIPVSVLNGPYDSYLWDDFTSYPTNVFHQSGTQGVTVSLNGCYKRVTDTFLVATPPVFNLQGALNICGANETTVFIPDSLALDSVAWSTGGVMFDSTYYSVSIGAGTYDVTIFDTSGLCQSDTSFTVILADSSVMFGDTVLCDGSSSFQVTGLSANPSGVWSASSTNITFSSTIVPEPNITASGPGNYTVSYLDDCGETLSAVITFVQLPSIFGDTAVCSLTYPVTGSVIDPAGGTWSSTSPEISFATATSVNPTITGSTSGVYPITFTDNVCGNTANATLQLTGPPAIISDQIACQLMLDITGTVIADPNAGIWSAADTSIHWTNTGIPNPTVWTSVAGTYTLLYTDTVCNVSTSVNIEFPPFAWTAVDDTIVCQGTEYTVFANENYTVDNFVWSTGETGPTIIVTEPGSYTVTASNVCHEYTATGVIGFKLCDIEAPNVLSLSSTEGNNLWFVQQQGLSEFKCTIVNRWGNLIYEFTDPNAGWSGQTMSGKIVEEGTYFYIIDARIEGGDELQKHGFIQVIH